MLCDHIGRGGRERNKSVVLQDAVEFAFDVDAVAPWPIGLDGDGVGQDGDDGDALHIDGGQRITVFGGFVIGGETHFGFHQRPCGHRGKIDLLLNQSFVKGLYDLLFVAHSHQLYPCLINRLDSLLWNGYESRQSKTPTDV